MNRYQLVAITLNVLISCYIITIPGVEYPWALQGLLISLTFPKFFFMLYLVIGVFIFTNGIEFSKTVIEGISIIFQSKK